MIGRRVGLLGATCAAAIGIAVPASAGGSFDQHFTVISKDTRGHAIPDGFEGHVALLNPANRKDRVGKGKVRCTLREGERKAHCRVLYHFDGTIGGFGDLLVKGNVGGDDLTLNVVDGSGDFAGAVGKMYVRDPATHVSPLDFDLVR
jgi:hypothetical protein